MTRALFLARLRQGLSDFSPGEIDDIVSDYEAHFADAAAEGRSEDEVSAALGDPVRLAKELRAEAGLRKFEDRSNPKNFLVAGLGLLALVGFDLIIVLPLLLLFLFVVGVIVYALHAMGSAGFHLALGLAHGAAATGLVGMALLSMVVGMSALVALVLVGVLRLLGKYARRRYRLLQPQNPVQGEIS